MEGRSKWRSRDPAEEKKSSSDEVRHCCFLTHSARSVKSSRVPSLEGRGRGVDVGEKEGRGRGVDVGEGRGWRGGRREDYDTFGFSRRRTCQCSWPMERGRDVSSLSVNGYCRDLHICKTLGLLVASLLYLILLCRRSTVIELCGGGRGESGKREGKRERGKRERKREGEGGRGRGSGREEEEERREEGGGEGEGQKGGEGGEGGGGREEKECNR